MNTACATARKPPPPTPEQLAKANAAKGPSALTQIVELQAKLRAACLDPNTSPAALAQCARAWEVLEERRRIIRMKPKPRDLDVSDSVRSRKAKHLPPPLILDSPPMEQSTNESKESIP